MSVDDLHSGAAHHTDFVTSHNVTLKKSEDGSGSFSSAQLGFLFLIFVSSFLVALTLIRLARREKEQQQHKDR